MPRVPIASADKPSKGPRARPAPKIPVSDVPVSLGDYVKASAWAEAGGTTARQRVLDHLGIVDVDELLARAIQVDGTPEFGMAWEWLADEQTYRGAGVVAMSYVLLKWTESRGWIFSVESPAHNSWFPVFSASDPRNRPDMFKVAMVIVRSTWTTPKGLDTFAAAAKSA